MIFSSFRPLFTPLSIGIFTLTLAACGGNNDAVNSAVPADNSGNTEVVEDKTGTINVSLTDSLGQFEGTVSAIGLWLHPSVPYQSAVVAANGKAGLFLIPMDRSEPASVTGDFSGGVAVGYTTNEGLVAAYDAERGGVRLLAIDPDTRTMTDIAITAASDGAKALCFIGTTLFRVADDGAVYRHVLDVDTGNLIFDLALVPNVRAKTCAASRDTVYFLSDSGRLLPISSDGAIGTSMATPVGTSAIAVYPTTEGDEFAAVNANGTITIGDKIILLGDDAGPLATMTIAAGSGNYGGAYRGGVMGVVSTENDLAVVAWLALTNAVGLDAPSVSLQGEGVQPSTDLADAPVIPEGAIDTTLSDDAAEKLKSFRMPPDTQPTAPKSDGE